MWQSVTNNDNSGDISQANTEPRPLDHVRETQNNPAYGGILGGETPNVKNDSDEMWDGIMSASGRKNVL